MMLSPRLHPFLGSAKQRLREEYRPRYAEPVERWKAKSVRRLTASGLLAGAREMLYRGVQYYTGVQTVIPAVILGEVPFIEFYNRLVRRSADPPAQTFLLGFDSVPIQAEKSLFDLAAWCREYPALAGALAGAPGPGERPARQR